jgi:hypothetical protein
MGLGFNEEFQICLESCSSPEKYTTVPHHITANFGRGRGFFELGCGGTFVSGNTNQHYIFYPIFGYRLLPLTSNKMNFRFFGELPFSGIETDDVFFFPFGISFGWGF